MIRTYLRTNQSRAGSLMFTKARDVARRGGLCMSKEALTLGKVAVENDNTAGHEARKNFRLGIGNLNYTHEIDNMNRSNRREDRNMRAHHCSQRRDFALVIHADLKDSKACILWHPCQ